jgi:hypothetical protein
MMECWNDGVLECWNDGVLVIPESRIQNPEPWFLSFYADSNVEVFCPRLFARGQGLGYKPYVDSLQTRNAIRFL